MFCALRELLLFQTGEASGSLQGAAGNLPGNLPSMNLRLFLLLGANSHPKGTKGYTAVALPLFCLRRSTQLRALFF